MSARLKPAIGPSLASNLIKAVGNRSIGRVLLERSALLVTLIKLADGTAAPVLEALTAQLRSVAKAKRLTLSS